MTIIEKRRPSIRAIETSPSESLDISGALLGALEESFIYMQPLLLCYIDQSRMLAFKTLNDDKGVLKEAVIRPSLLPICFSTMFTLVGIQVTTTGQMRWAREPIKSSARSALVEIVRPATAPVQRPKASLQSRCISTH